MLLRCESLSRPCRSWVRPGRGGMSALVRSPPKLRTLAGGARQGGAEKCHKRSFDHLGGAGDQGRRKADAERVRRLEIDDELEVRGQLERHVRGPCAA